MDALPVFSQLKSFVQWVCRDPEGAKNTQINFSRQCPVISQARSAVEAALGRKQDARDTQKEFGKFVGAFVNAIPVAGHVKGAIHYAMRNKEQGDAAMKAASHTTAVIGGGVGGFLVAGPPGAFAGGVGAGVAIDSTITAVDSVIKKEFEPYGVLEPLGDPTNPGKWCDAVGGMVIDGVTGRCAGKVVKQIQLKQMSKGAAVADSSIVDTVIQERAIPRPLGYIGSRIVMELQAVSGKIFFKVMEVGQQYVEKKSLNVPVYDDTGSLYNMKDDVSENADKFLEDACAEEAKVSFKLNGCVLEVYHKEKLVAIHNEEAKYIITDKGMEQIKDGYTYRLLDNGSFAKEATSADCSKTSSQYNSTCSLNDGDPEVWFDSSDSHPLQHGISCTYDSSTHKLLWSNNVQDSHSTEDEEHRSLHLAVENRSLQLA